MMMFSFGTTDPRDAMLQVHAPAVMMPLHAPQFEPLAENGHRYLVGAEGLWIEVRRPWLHLVHPIAESIAPLPFGPVAPHAGIEVPWGTMDLHILLAKFYRQAQMAMPFECAAWGVYDETTRRLDYMPLTSTSSSGGHVQFLRPPLPSHVHLAIDLHSHAAGDAFWSATDDEDDEAEVKIAVVVGDVNFGQRPRQMLVRICAHGLLQEISLDV